MYVCIYTHVCICIYVCVYTPHLPLKEGMTTHSSILAWRIPKDKGAWWATVHGVTKSQPRPRIVADHSFFIRSSVSGHLGCFHVLAVVNSAAVNSAGHASLGAMFFSGYMSRSGIAGSNGSSVFIF